MMNVPNFAVFASIRDGRRPTKKQAVLLYLWYLLGRMVGTPVVFLFISAIVAFVAWIFGFDARAAAYNTFTWGVPIAYLGHMIEGIWKVRPYWIQAKRQ